MRGEVTKTVCASFDETRGPLQMIAFTQSAALNDCDLTLKCRDATWKPSTDRLTIARSRLCG